MTDNPTGGLDDRLCRTIILLQADDPGTGEIIVKIEDITDLGAPPAVDRLVVVTDHTKVFLRPDQQLNQPVLDPVGILKLIHQQIFETLLPMPSDFRMFLKQAHRQQQQITEIDGIGRLHALLVKGIELGQLPLIGTIFKQQLRTQATIFGPVDKSRGGPRFQHFFRNSLLFEQITQQPQLVLIIVNSKVTAEAEMLNLLAQNSYTTGVEGCHPGEFPVIEQALKPLTHLGRRLVGKSDRHNPPDRHPPFADQVGHPVGQRPGLSRTGPSQQQ